MNETTCEQCGKSDDHPKVVTSDAGNFHHDCLPFRLKEKLVENPLVAKIIEAAEGGKRGQDLRDHIASLHEEK
jgi:hypothetical protein